MLKDFRPGDVDADGIVEVFDGCSGGGLQLDDVGAVGERFLIDDDFHILDLAVLTEALYCVNAAP